MKCRTRDAYLDFKNWAVTVGEYAPDEKRFGATVEKRFMRGKDSRSRQAIFLGLHLSAKAAEDLTKAQTEQARFP